MKMNKNWEPMLVRCIRCEKDFNVNYTVGENDNCLPVLNRYNLERMFRGHIDDYNWSDEEVLQWLNITSVLFICPYCHHRFGSTMNCYVCNKPVYHWLGHGTGYTCSEKCSKIYLQWIEDAKKRGRGGVIPREAVYGKNNEFSNDMLKKNSRRNIMDKCFLITEHEYEGIMMTTDTSIRIQEFESENVCDDEIEKIKINNEQEFYKINILKVIKGKELRK